MPDISVIVPARDAAPTLRKTLAALSAQDFDGEFEVVVVDDASDDETPRIAEEMGARVVSNKTPLGPAGSRNAGVEAADSPILAFTDADCEPTPGWLSALSLALASADLATGPVRPDPDGPVGVFHRTLNIDAGSALFETANLAVSREVFERVGGFEPFEASPGSRGMRPAPGGAHFGEDVVFGWRARRYGARIAAAEGALVHHAVFPRGPLGYIRERPRLSYFPALLTEVPELRDACPLGLFLSKRTALFDLALAGALTALVSRRRWPLLATTPYVRRCMRTSGFWRRSAVRENLAMLTGDAVGAVALVRGSIAARRLLL